jgi:hypothetical protein
MDSKSAVEQFINNCFRERTEALKLRLEIHHVYWQRFYQSECRWDSRRGVLASNDAEKIVDISPLDDGFAVVTTGNHPNHRSRFRVKPVGENWLIEEVDAECLRCRLSGASTGCVECNWTGWQSWKDRVDRSKRWEQERVAQTPRLEPNEELEGNPLSDPAIEMFMTDFFRERTESLKKEMEIEANYVKRFYGPECEWIRWVGSVKSSEAETIVKMAPADTEVLVMTSGFGAHHSRYHLRATGQSWLIWEVDMECPFCRRNGWSANCIWCAGTIWEHKKIKMPSRGELPGEEPPSQKPRWQP